MAPRMTIATRLVLGVLMSDFGAEWYGSQIGKVAGLPSGTVHPILARLERVGWCSEHPPGRATSTPAGRDGRRAGTTA